MSTRPSGTIHLRLPEWVAQPEAVVSAVELTLLEWGAETGAPGPVASWRALRWVAATDGTPAPVSNVPCAATRARALVEYERAAAILAGRPYPVPDWFAGHGLGPHERPGPWLWEAYARHRWGREVGRGVTEALGWVIGVAPDPAGMVPRVYESGVDVPASVRQQWSARLVERTRSTAEEPVPEPGATLRQPPGDGVVEQ